MRHIALLGLLECVVELHPHDGEEDDVDEEKDDDCDAAPLEPEHFFDALVDGFGGVGADAGVVGGEAGAVVCVGAVVGPYVS